MIRLLLTGGEGQLGRALAKRLETECQVAAFSRQELDITRPDHIRRRMAEVRPHLVVNAAAWTDVDMAESDPRACHAVNAQAPAWLSAAAQKQGAAILHFSSDYVFDGGGDTPWREEDIPTPLNAYGVSKLAGERLVAGANPAHMILRTSWVYDATGRNFLTAMLKRMREQESLRVVADQFGAPTPAHALADAVSAILVACGNSPKDGFTQKGGLFHCACAGKTSWHGFAEAIRQGASAGGLPLAVKRLEPVLAKDYPRPAKRPANSQLSLAKLAQRFAILMPAWDQALLSVLDEALKGHQPAADDAQGIPGQQAGDVGQAQDAP